MSEPSCSILLDGRLIAYVYPCDEQEDEGVLLRANVEEPLAPLTGARIETFSQEHEALFIEVAAKKPSAEGFLFALQLEGFEVRDGRAKPHKHLRRF
ncbi:MAG: hypothetical protein AAF658_00765 [Myxococcota bacterium]